MLDAIVSFAVPANVPSTRTPDPGNRGGPAREIHGAFRRTDTSFYGPSEAMVCRHQHRACVLENSRTKW